MLEIQINSNHLENYPAVDSVVNRRYLNGYAFGHLSDQTFSVTNRTRSVNLFTAYLTNTGLPLNQIINKIDLADLKFAVNHVH